MLYPIIRRPSIAKTFIVNPAVTMFCTEKAHRHVGSSDSNATKVMRSRKSRVSLHDSVAGGYDVVKHTEYGAILHIREVAIVE